MAKKPARKQAPPKPGETAIREPAVGDEPSVESLVAALGGAQSDASEEEAEPAPEAIEPESADGSEPPAVEAPASDEVAPDAESAEPEPAPEATDGIKLVDSLPIDPDDDLSEVEGEASLRLVSIVESLLFASTKPLRVKQLRKILNDPSIRQIQLALKHLIGQNEDRGIILAQVAGGFVLQTSPKNATWVQTLLQAKPVRLSRPQLETLAVVAYRQPVTRPEIDHIRGVDSGAVLKLLLERELIQIVGKKDEVGRPMLFGTTVGFLEFFNLMSLRDLPDLREFRELSEESKATLRKNMGEEEVEALGQEVLQFARPEGTSSAQGDDEEAAAIEEGGEGEILDEPDADSDAEAGDEAEQGVEVVVGTEVDVGAEVVVGTEVEVGAEVVVGTEVDEDVEDDAIEVVVAEADEREADEREADEPEADEPEADEPDEDEPEQAEEVAEAEEADEAEADDSGEDA
jgi:segregation and condensation protein B